RRRGGDADDSGHRFDRMTAPFVNGAPSRSALARARASLRNDLGLEAVDQEIKAKLETFVVVGREHRLGQRGDVRELIGGKAREVRSDLFDRWASPRGDLENRRVEIATEDVTEVRRRAIGNPGAAHYLEVPFDDAEHLGSDGDAADRKPGEVVVPQHDPVD